MKNSRLLFIGLFALKIGLASIAYAEPDQYMGDSSIYVGVPQDVGTPNVLFIIDNSSATENAAVGAPYEAYERDPVTDLPTSTVRVYDALADQTINPWDIYRVDKQGDFELISVSNSTYDLENLDCMGVDPNDNTKSIDVIRSTLHAYGTYTSSGTDTHPTISVNGNGTCTYNIGGVYALGNYLRYVIQGGGNQAINCESPAVVYACKNSNSCGYFELTTTFAITDSDNCNPALPQCGTSFWKQVSQPVDPDGVLIEVDNWSDVYNVGNGVADVDGNGSDEIAWVVPSCWSQILGDTQREIVFNALRTVIGGAAGSVKIGAMVYDKGGNKGGLVVADVADLSVGLPTALQADGSYKIISPDCTTTGVGTGFCDFLAAIPGPDRNGDGNFDGYPMLDSQTARPQAEALFDAGYYFGAFQDADHVSPNATRIPSAVESTCKLNHVILITNGMSNSDGDPIMGTVVGDADTDNYPDENQYGLGSHWLDDVAKYLANFNEITTHTILAFQSDDTLVRNAAKDGDGRYYNVQSAEELSRRLTELLANIVSERNTSFVAPVVPASTTNRTVSSNRVYLGLFKPQDDGPWHGNVKKYGFDMNTNQLTEPPADPAVADLGDLATDQYGHFYPDSVSFWSDQNGVIITSDVDLNPNSNDTNAVKGDGGVVDAGGVGGVLLKRMRDVSTEIIANGVGSASADYRDIFTFISDENGVWTKESVDPTNAGITDAMLDLPPTNSTDLSWWTSGGWPSNTDAQRKWNLLAYLHGLDSLDVDGSSESNLDVRDWVMGDILHSRPVVFNYSFYDVAQENMCTPSVSGGPFNSSVVFVGTNDGMMHAFRDCDGRELWSFVPDNVLPYLKYLPELEHTSYVDSPPAIYFHDVDSDGVVDSGDGDKVVMVFGQRRGGGKNTLDNAARGAYYALDITTPTTPEMLWKFSVEESSALLAETWALPAIHTVKVLGNDNAASVVAFLPAGYDNNEDLRYGNTQAFPDATGPTTNINLAPTGGTVDGSGSALTSPGSDPDGHAMRGRGLLAIEVAYLSRADVDTDFTALVSPDDRTSIGQVYWSYSPSDMKYSFVSDLRALDMNRNGGFIDTLYVGDAGGNMWRIDTSDRNKANWSGNIIFSSNSTYTETNTGYIDGTADNNSGRKIFYPPAVAVEGGVPWVCFGTGDREHPLNLAVTDRMYCIKDYGQTTADAIDELNLVDVTENELQLGSSSTADIDLIKAKLRSSPAHPIDANGVADPYGDAYYGWYIRLDGKDRDSSGDPGEKILAESVIFEGEVFMSTYQLKTGARAGCDAGNLGVSRLYRLNLKTGESVYNYDTLNDMESTSTNTRAEGAEGEVLRRTDRVYELGEGIPSGVVQVISNTGKVGLLISSSDKVEGIGGANAAVTFPLYWIQW